MSWNGVAIGGLPESARDKWRRENAGFVFQSFNLIDELSPLENVLLPARFGGAELAPLRPRAQGLLAEFKVPSDRRTVSLLSRGEQQRVAIARALLRDPGVIFADEPTASLDADAAARIATTLKEMAAEQRRTVVVASHDPALLALADRTVRLDHGQTAADNMRAVEA